MERSIVSRETAMEAAQAREREILAEVMAGDERAWGDFVASWRYWREADRWARSAYERLAGGGGLSAVTDDEVAALYLLDARQARRSSGRTNALRCFEAMRQKSWKARYEEKARELARVRGELAEVRAEAKETLRRERVRMEAVVRREVTGAVMAEVEAKQRAKEGVAELLGQESKPDTAGSTGGPSSLGPRSPG